MRYPLLTAALLMLAMTSAVATPATPSTPANEVYTADKPNVMVTSSNPSFTLKLKANPTTGYLWFLRDCDADLVTPQKHEFEKPETKLAGAPGFDLWTFKMKPNAFLVPRQTAIRMVYARPFSSENATPVMFTVSTMK